MDDEKKELMEKENDKNDETIFSVTEITIEEMAIDGICGVY